MSVARPLGLLDFSAFSSAVAFGLFPLKASDSLANALQIAHVCIA